MSYKFLTTVSKRNPVIAIERPKPPGATRTSKAVKVNMPENIPPVATASTTKPGGIVADHDVGKEKDVICVDSAIGSG